ncbi:MAG: CotH kinase family protein [Verrucomicrobiota bacterium]
MNLHYFCARSGRHAVRLVLMLALGASLALLHAANPAPGKSKRTGAPDEIFTNNVVPRIEIEIPEAGMETLRDYRWQGFRGGEQKRPAVKATVREGHQTYKDVSIHLKGAAGSFRSVDDEPALTLNFDKHVKGQTFHGLERFSLNNSVQDRSLLNEQITREIFAAAGVPVPRATHARVLLNGRDLGLYVLTEAFNKQFLAGHFKNADGNLYDGGFLKDVGDGLTKSSGRNPQDKTDLQRLARAAEQPSTNRMGELRQVLDVDRFITYLAIDIMTCNWDGYAINRNNYRLYHDPDSDQFVFMPHGLDQMFGVMRVSTDMPLFPRMNGLVARAVLQAPEGRQRYRERMTQLLESQFNVEALTNRVHQLAAKIRPGVVESGGANAGRSLDREVNQFCERIADRVAYIRERLGSQDSALKFDGDGLARLGDWKSRVEFGTPVLNETEEGGKKLLHISANSGSCVGIWVTRARLEPGRYRLEGKMRSRGVSIDAGDRKGGAGFRTSVARPSKKLAGDTDWTDISFDFELRESSGDFGFMGPIQEDLPDVELICDLRAAKGEVWFDRDSIRLRRK